MTIKIRLLVPLLTLAIVPLLLLGVTNYIVSKDNLQQKTLLSLEIIVDHKAKQVEEFLDSKRRAAEILTKSIVVNNYLPTLIHYSHNFEHPEFRRATKEFDEKLINFQKTFQLADIVVTDSQGKALYLSNKEHSKRWRGSSLPIENYDNQKHECLLSYFKNAHKEGAYGILVSKPVTTDSGELMGFIALEVDLDPISKVIADTSGLGENGFSKLGKKISEQEYISVAKSASDSSDVSVISAPSSNFGLPMQLAIQGRSGSGSGFSCGQNEVFAAWKHISPMNMGLVSTTVLSTIQRLRLSNTAPNGSS